MRKGMLVTLLALSVLVILSSCGGGGSAPLTIGGGVGDDENGSTSAFVMVIEGDIMTGNPVEDAVVAINGTDLINFGFGMYMSIGDLDINPGVDVVLEVQRGSTLIIATLPMPEKPVIIAPVAAETVVGAVIGEWTSTTDPDIFGIDVDGTLTDSGTEYSAAIAGDLRSHSMSGVFDTASNASKYSLSAVNYTDSLAGATADSTFEVESTTMSPTFNPD